MYPRVRQNARRAIGRENIVKARVQAHVIHCPNVIEKDSLDVSLLRAYATRASPTFGSRRFLRRPLALLRPA